MVIRSLWVPPVTKILWDQVTPASMDFTRIAPSVLPAAMAAPWSSLHAYTTLGFPGSNARSRSTLAGLFGSYGFAPMEFGN